MADREKVRGDLLAIKTYLNSQAIEAKDKIVREAFMESAQNIDDALALLKEQEKQKQKWLQSIADNQLANAPKHDRNDFMSLDEHMEYQYQLGVYDGLQMAWEILTEGR